MTTDLNIRYEKDNYRCLVHLDRLSITFRHCTDATFRDIRNPDNIPAEQTFKNISLIHYKKPGHGAFYHTFIVYHKGLLVGKLHTATKALKHELQFDFSKEVFYSFYSNYWYEVYNALKSELGLAYNNIMYMEISIDTDKNLVKDFIYYYQNCKNNELRVSERYQMKNNTSVSVMHNGTYFLIDGSDNEIAVYNKTAHAEDYILNYFSINSLGDSDVYRIEARLTWNYIKSLRYRKGLDINIDTLTDNKKMAEMFRISTKNKTLFKDTQTKICYKNRNAKYKEISITDDLPIETAEIGRLNPEMKTNHYKDNKIVDVNILRQIYYRFLETGNGSYYKNFKASAAVAGYDDSRLRTCILKFNSRYKGNRTGEISQRMQYTMEKVSSSKSILFQKIFFAMALKLKWSLWGIG